MRCKFWQNEKNSVKLTWIQKLFRIDRHRNSIFDGFRSTSYIFKLDFWRKCGRNRIATAEDKYHFIYLLKILEYILKYLPMNRGRGTGGANAPPKFQILLIKFCRKTIFKFFYKVRAPPIQNCFRGPCSYIYTFCNIVW